MSDSFEKWINGMSESEYEDWLEDNATDAQEEKALNIRTPLSNIEEEDMLLEQGQEPEPEEPSSRIREIETEPEQPEPRSRIQEIFDNRDLPPERFTADVIIPPTGQPIILPRKTQYETRQPITNANIPLTTQYQTSLPRTIRQPTVQPQPRQPSRIRQFANRIGTGFRNLFRRNKK